MNALDKDTMLKYIDQRKRHLKDHEHDLNTYREITSLEIMLKQGVFDVKVWSE